MQILILGFRQFDFQRFLLFRLSLHKHSSMQMISFLYRQSFTHFHFSPAHSHSTYPAFLSLLFASSHPARPYKMPQMPPPHMAQKQIANIERSHQHCQKQHCQKQHGHTTEPSLCIQKNRWYYILNAADQPPADKAKGQAE